MNAETKRVAEIKRLHATFNSEELLENAFKCGELLHKQRQLVERRKKKGGTGWMQWMKENLKFSRTTADNYIQLHKYRNRLQGVCNLNEAHAEVKKLRADGRRKKKGNKKKKADNLRYLDYKFNTKRAGDVKALVQWLQNNDAFKGTEPSDIIYRCLMEAKERHDDRHTSKAA